MRYTNRENVLRVIEVIYLAHQLERVAVSGCLPTLFEVAENEGQSVTSDSRSKFPPKERPGDNINGPHMEV